MKLTLILTTLLLTIDLSFAQARAPKHPAKPDPIVYHYYGVTKDNGTLQLLGSSADEKWFGKTYGTSDAAGQLFHTVAIVYKTTAPLEGVNFIWRDDQGKPGIRWNQEVAVPSGPPLPDKMWIRPHLSGVNNPPLTNQTTLSAK